MHAWHTIAYILESAIYIDIHIYIIHTIKLHITYVHTQMQIYIQNTHKKKYRLSIYTYTHILIPKITYYMYTNLHTYKQVTYITYIYTCTHTHK